LSVPGIDSWYHEKESAWLYRRVAAEPDPKKRELFLQPASASFVTVGAAVPLLPLLHGASGTRAVLGSAALTLLALFAVGLGLSLFTGRAAWHSALRMVLIGGGAGTLSFLVGRALGVAIS
jgi:VIT1/CCC1 family predicted Fe2+/Mn2+ transporter